MRTAPVICGLLSLMLCVAACGCSASARETSAAPTRIELTGTPGAPVHGYYIHDGRRVDLDAVLPTTLPEHGVSQFAVRKSNAQDELVVLVSGPGNSLRQEVSSGVRVRVAGGLYVETLDPDELLTANANALMTIRPYWYEGTWVFDDPQVGLRREPFVSGVPEMINTLVQDIPDARTGFRLTFSATPFPGFQRKLHWVRAESGGNRYRLDHPPMEGWLCPAMFRYFDQTPKELFVRADPIPPHPASRPSITNR